MAHRPPGKLALAVERKRKRKRKNTADAVAKLPAEVLMEIMSKLPISTVLQLSHKFPEYKPLIFDPHFNNIFQSYHHASTPCTLLGFYNEGSYSDNKACLIEYRPNTTKMGKTVRLYNLDMESFIDANARDFGRREKCSSCNGWILVRSILEFDHHFFDTLRVVNPATRRCLIFHSEPDDTNKRKPKLDSFIHDEINYSLGYSSKTGKYKVVKIVISLNYSHILHQKKPYDVSFEVFDILGDEQRWKKLDFDYASYDCDPPRSQVVLNDALHWLWSNNTILRFDIDKEEFEFIPTPYNENKGFRSIFLAASCGLLYLGAYNNMLKHDVLEIWVMKEYGEKDSWVRLSEIQKRIDYPYDFLELELFQVLDNGKKMLFIWHRSLNDKLQLYDIETGIRESLVMRGIPSEERTQMKILPYVPNFFSLDGSA